MNPGHVHLPGIGDIFIDLLDPHHCDPRDVLSMAETYREVYRTDSAWLEEFQCPKCHKVFGPLGNKEVHGILVCNNCPCNPPLVEMWTIPNILSEQFYNHICEQSQFVCSIARDVSGKIIGFCWGYTASAKALGKTLIGANGLSRKLCRRFGHDPYFYQKDAVVLPKFQKVGIGTLLMQKRNQAFMDIDPDAIALFRTLREPPSRSYILLINKIGYKIFLDYTDPEEQRRKIIGVMPVAAAATAFDERVAKLFKV